MRRRGLLCSGFTRTESEGKRRDYDRALSNESAPHVRGASRTRGLSVNPGQTSKGLARRHDGRVWHGRGGPRRARQDNFYTAVLGAIFIVGIQDPRARLTEGLRVHAAIGNAVLRQEASYRGRTAL
jgi:hypothetical protein